MRRMQALVDAPIDIHQAPLFRTALYKLGPQEHAFLFMPHHIIWDGWSFDLLYTEMAACYTALTQDRSIQLPALPATYADYAHWQAEWMQSEAFDRQLRNWNARMAQAPLPKAPNTDKPRSAGMSGEGSTEWVRIDKPTTERLRDLARQADVTLNMLTLAVYGAMMASVAGSSTIVIGVPVRGRMMTEIEPVMGFFNNLLPLQLRIDPAQTAAAFLRGVKQELLDVLNFQDIPFERLAMEPDMMARSQRAGIYQALFSFQDARERTRQWGDLTQSGILIFQKGATEDLGLWLMEVPGGLEGGFTYNADIYTAQTAAAFRARYLELVQRLAADPQQSLAKLLDGEGSVAAAGLEHLIAADAPPARAPDGLAPVAGRTPAQARRPLTDTEQALVDVWSSLLGLQPDQIDLQDNHFDLGGDSLTAMQAVIRMHERTGKRVNANLLIYESLGQIGRRYDELEVETPAEAVTKSGLVKRLFGGMGLGKKTNAQL
jgi:acyl carrier protein